MHKKEMSHWDRALLNLAQKIITTTTHTSLIPNTMANRACTFFVPPYWNDTQNVPFLAIAQELEIPIYCGRYNGPQRS